MAITTATLSGTITDVVGEVNPRYSGRIVMVVESNTTGSILRDTVGNVLMAGAKRINVDGSSGAYSQALVTTDSPDIVPADDRLYRVTLIYPSGVPGKGNVTATSGWFALIADTSLADVWQGIEVTAVSSAVYASISQSVTDAQTAATAAEAARDGAVAITGPVDATVEGLIKNTGGIGPLTSAALSATIEEGVAPVVEAVEVETIVRNDADLAVNDMRGFGIDAQTMFPALGVAGEPVLTLQQSRIPARLMRQGSSDRVVVSFDAARFAHFRNVDIDVVWLNPDITKTGTVALRAFLGAWSLGDALSTLTNLNVTSHKVTVTTAGSLQRTRIARNVDISRAMTPTILLDRVPADETALGTGLAGSFGLVKIIVTPTVDAPELTGDGAWCWFNDARLLADQARNKLYSSYVTENGSIGVSSLDTTTGAKASFVLHDRLEADDHDTPGMTLLPDGNLIAFYSKHSVIDDPIYWRKTTTPGDVTTFGALQTITLPSGGQPCYPKPAQVGSRLYVFFRNALYQDYIYSDNGGTTWSTPATAFVWNAGWRGYVNLIVNNDRVDFLINDDNPNASGNTNLQHCYLDASGNLRKTDGTLIAALSAGGITTGQMSRVYTWLSDGDAWGWDLALDSQGRPRVVFATFPGAAAASVNDRNHHYKYARWTGSAWVVSAITNDGGPSIADRGGEYRYSGGIAILPSNTDVVYTSRLVGQQWEIERWTTADAGLTWQVVESVTRASRDKQVRPTTPRRHYPGCPEVAWMSGMYVAFSARYSTRLAYRP